MNDAIISKDGLYRYALTRDLPGMIIKPRASQSILFIGLNPSTADAVKNDPTITREMRFADLWGYGQLVKANLFGFRTSHPRIMMTEAEPVGPDNDRWLLHYARMSGRIIAAWGIAGGHMDRDLEVLRLLRDAGLADRLFCLGITQGRFPKHTLARGKGVIPYSFQPIPFRM